MSRQPGMVWAGTLLLLAVGCTPPAFLSPFGSAGENPPVVVAGSVTRVSATLQAALKEAGVPVIAKRDRQGLLLVGTTRAHKMFSLHFQRDKTAKEEKTEVLIKWDTTADEQVGALILQTLNSLSDAVQ